VLHKSKTMEDFKSIIKVVACLLGFLLLFYFYFLRLSPSRADINKEVLETCLPLQYDFRVMSFYDECYFNFEGRTKEGRIVKYKLPHNWNLDNDVCSEGDSIHKLAGENMLWRQSERKNSMIGELLLTKILIIIVCLNINNVNRRTNKFLCL
jgi:hypothetical protein